MLLGREEVDPIVTDTNWGETPLSGAAGRGHEETMKMLREKEDANQIW